MLRNNLLFRKLSLNSKSITCSNKICKRFSTDSPLIMISPLDGRYANQLTGLKKYYSEKGLMKYRTIVELEWLRFLIRYNINI